LFLHYQSLPAGGFQHEERSEGNNLIPTSARVKACGHEKALVVLVTSGSWAITVPEGSDSSAPARFMSKAGFNSGGVENTQGASRVSINSATAKKKTRSTAVDVLMQ